MRTIGYNFMVDVKNNSAKIYSETGVRTKSWKVKRIRRFDRH